ncbi:MAG: hypothetical protein EBZ49_11540 [Proteobacteria bacterium]|nr:hypothetical protein [Pseudomonadota bacterium]
MTAYVKRNEAIRYFEDKDSELYSGVISDLTAMKGDELDLFVLHCVLEEHLNAKKAEVLMRDLEGELFVYEANPDSDPDLATGDLPFEALSEEDIEKLGDIDYEDEWFDGDNVSF